MMDPQMLMMLLNGAGSMMQAGAPSTNPASGSFANALGAGLQGGVKGYAAGDEMIRSQQYMRMMQEAMQRKAMEGQEPVDPEGPKRPDSIVEMLRRHPAFSQYLPGYMSGLY